MGDIEHIADIARPFTAEADTTDVRLQHRKAARAWLLSGLVSSFCSALHVSSLPSCRSLGPGWNSIYVTFREAAAICREYDNLCMTGRLARVTAQRIFSCVVALAIRLVVFAGDSPQTLFKFPGHGQRRAIVERVKLELTHRFAHGNRVVDIGH
jgi:hypothetical protein